MSNTPKITVIICTFNRAQLLSETLPTICEQDVPSTNYNILIVNNNSTDNTEEIILSFVNSYENVSTINEPQQGLSYARNTGYKNATTKWIIYLDDDAKAPKTFIDIALTIANSNKYDCFGGIYYPWYKYGKPKWFKDIYASTAEFYKNVGGHKLQFASGGIMAIKRSILVELNGFPTNIGMKGNSMAYGEETFLQNRMHNKGYSIGIIQEWNIQHIVNEYKLKPLWYINNGYVSGRDYWITYDEKVTLKLIMRYSLNIFISLFKKTYQNTKLLFKNNYYMQNWIIETLRPVSLNIGRIISGIRILIKNSFAK